ncbi:HobA family DNA replication regulator [Helicobacter anatolicus]|uniref:HobA family DNA replication regulator n=1 Tax=Helicobacter anatolicus TaxID=2905874 RepID=UPI001E64AA28|nr:HobA family DNA replication regulator [Helicobacter anatolicus]MCE3038759.1 HobA family DNA replication regulator [Helicobacter anatolicus]
MELSDWVLKTIREENNKIALNSDWLEIDRFVFTTLLSHTITYVINGGTLLFCSDEHFEWFGRYVTQSINRFGASRPLVPIYLLEDFLPKIKNRDNDLVHNVLSLSFNDYAFWYVGKMQSDLSKLAFSRDNGFLWVLDDSMQKALNLDSKDRMIEYKLIQLYKIFEQALFGAMFGDITIT